MSLTLYKKHNYVNSDIKYLKDIEIIEYDLTNAGISILKTKELLDISTINYLNSLDKLSKNITVGKMIDSNKEWSKIMMNEYVKIRKKFMILNDLNDDDILSIKKDALFIIGKKCNKLKIGKNYRFKAKNIYQSYLFIQRKEIYIDMINSKFDTKNFMKTVLKDQEDKFIKFLVMSVVIDIKDNKNEVFNYIKEFRSKFINKELDIEYYRELDNEEKYVFKTSDNSSILYCSDYYIFGDNKEKLYIKNNYKYIEELIKILLS